MKLKAFCGYGLVGVALCAATLGAFAQTTSPAEQGVATAEKKIAARPTAPDGYNELAIAFARRARETADGSYYDRAEEAIQKSLRLAPDNFEAQKARAWVLLGKHEFAQALTLAQTLNKEVPDDVLVYGFLTDAHAELGQYKEAEEACQWMLDLRPGNIPALTRAAYLRELFGDVEGAIDLMRVAYERTAEREVEDRAWILTQLGHLEFIAGRTDAAEELLNHAIDLFPDYHYALAQLAKVRTAQGKHAEAVTLLKRRYELAPHPENLYAVGEALTHAGRLADARAAYDEFETRALRESKNWDNANRELIFYYVDRAKKPAEALNIAEMEVARRQDVHTLDAYAWALHANNRASDARRAIDKAIAVGVRDPEMLVRSQAILGAERQ
jgi:tetratricopeptide (TPR) repeat protein